MLSREVPLSRRNPTGKPARAAAEAVACVVDDLVRADRSNEVELRGGARAGDGGAEGFRDLYGEVADAPGRAQNEHLRTGADAGHVTQRLQGRARRDRHGRRLLRRQVRWPGGAAALGDAGVLGERAGPLGSAVAEYLVPLLEAGDAGAHGLDDAGGVPAGDLHLGREESEAHEAHHVWPPSHHVPDARIHGAGVSPI
jgi:hypothetical protein